MELSDSIKQVIAKYIPHPSVEELVARLQPQLQSVSDRITHKQEELRIAEEAAARVSELRTEVAQLTVDKSELESALSELNPAVQEEVVDQPAENVVTEENQG